MAHTSSCLRCQRPLIGDAQLCETCRRCDTSSPESAAFWPTRSAVPDQDALIPLIGRPEVPPPELPGFRFLDSLGGGGMGVVYLARELAADRLVALKLVRAACDPAARDRFQVEVRSMARLDHPNIVRVLTVETEAREPYFTMEYVDGPGLDRRLLAEGPLLVDEAVRIIEQVARAVQHAHDHGVIHRDLKPGNVVVGSDGVPRVTDFGLAKRLYVDDGLTVPEAVLGTPGFMAPEQTGGRNEEVGRAADIYGLGATLYALLTGQPPFTGATPVETACRARTQPPRPPRDLRPEIPRELEAIILKCLEKDSARRYPTAEAVADDLVRWRKGERTLARPPGRLVRLGRAVRHRTRAVAVGGMTVLGLLALAAWVNSEPKPHPDPLEQAQRDLAAGKPVVVVPSVGEPRFPIWRLNSAEFMSAPGLNGACYYRTAGLSMLQLFPAPRAKEYLFGAELKLLPYTYPNNPVADDAVAAALPRAGIYFGHVEQDTEKGQRISILRLCFNEYLTEENVKRGYDMAVVEFERSVVVQWSDGSLLTNEATRGIAHTLFRPVAEGMPPWRWLGARVTPDGVALLWRDNPDAPTRTVAFVPDGEIARHGLALQAAINNHPRLRGIRVADWHPQLPLGIYCRNATIAVRNVTLEPLTD
jgi:hypothetical protein